MKHHGALSLQLNSCTDCVHVLNAVVEVLACRAGLQAMETGRVTLAINELFANIVKHGYGHDTGVIEFEGYLSETDAVKKMHFMFRDYAPVLHDVEMFKTSPCQSEEALKPGGLGVYLMHCVMECVQHEALKDGNCWRLVFACGLEEDGENEA